MKPTVRCIRRNEVKNKTGLSYSLIRLLEMRGEFPKHFLLTPRCAVYDEAEVDAFIESRRNNPAQPIPIAVAK